MKHTPRNRVYLILIVVIFIPLICIVAYSFCEKEICFGPFCLRKTDIASHFQHKANVSDTLMLDTLTQVSDTVVPDTTSQRILLFGDSMVEGLSRRLKYYAAENGHELLNVIWYSSSTKIWAQRDTLAHFIRQFQPTYFMVCLGGNELFVRDLDKREEYIRTIIDKMGNSPFVWIGPPNWKEDTGINELFKNNAGERRFFPSKDLIFERASDGAHPTQAASNIWMDSVAVWVARRSCHPIRMEVPTRDTITGKTVVLRPLK